MRTAVFVTGICLSLVGVSYASGAIAAAERIKTEIPPEALGPALAKLAQMRDMQVLYLSKTVQGRRTAGANGELTADEALTRLLSGTGLTYRFLAQDTVTILPIKPVSLASGQTSGGSEQAAAEPARTAKEGKSSSSGTFRVAQVAKGATAGDDSLNQEREGSASAGSPGLQEIVVTAQKYEQAAYNVPVSLTVLTADTLRNFGVTDIEDLQYQVPGLLVQSTGAQRRIFLGGVANTSGNGSLVAEYIDDADVTASPNIFAYASLDLRTYDLARVEVLRGPQGTLYGEGAEGGAIHYVTNQPILDAYQFGIRGESLFTKDGAPSESVFPMINIPIVPDELAIRIAGEYSHEGGWIDFPAAQQKNINSQDLTDTRIEALWKPSGQFQLNLMEIIHRNDLGLNIDANTKEDYTAPFGLDVSPREQDQYNLSNLTAQYTMPDIAELVNSATYVRDANSAPAFGVLDQFDGLQELFYNSYTFSDFSDELRLTNEGVASSPWRWTVGGFFKHAVVSNLPSGFCLGLDPSTVGTDALISSNLSERMAACDALPESFWVPLGSDIQSKQESEFADVNYKIIDRLTVGAGARYFKEQQHYFAIGVQSQSATFSSTDPRVYALYEVSDHVNAYASVAKGFRSGGFNTVGSPPFEPESLWYYDLGIKTHGFQSFDLSGDVYYGDYSNFQSLGIADNIAITRNGGVVHLKGADATVQWRPGRGWRVRVEGEYTDARVVSLGGFTGTPQLVGEALNWTLRYQLNASLEKDFPVGGRPGYLTLGYMQRPGAGYDPVPGLTYYNPNQYILDLTAGVQWSDNLSLGMMVQNALDDRAYLDPFYLVGAGATERPLTVGLYMDAKF